MGKPLVAGNALYEETRDLPPIMQQLVVIGDVTPLTTRIPRFSCYAHRFGPRGRIPTRCRAIVFDEMRG